MMFGYFLPCALSISWEYLNNLKEKQHLLSFFDLNFRNQNTRISLIAQLTSD
jgi:hypothetical protein